MNTKKPRRHSTFLTPRIFISGINRIISVAMHGLTVRWPQFLRSRAWIWSALKRYEARTEDYHSQPVTTSRLVWACSSFLLSFKATWWMAACGLGRDWTTRSTFVINLAPINDCRPLTRLTWLAWLRHPLEAILRSYTIVSSRRRSVDACQAESIIGRSSGKSRTGRRGDCPFGVLNKYFSFYHGNDNRHLWVVGRSPHFWDLSGKCPEGISWSRLDPPWSPWSENVDFTLIIGDTKCRFVPQLKLFCSVYCTQINFLVLNHIVFTLLFIAL